jgi:hypothetical protein
VTPRLIAFDAEKTDLQNALLGFQESAMRRSPDDHITDARLGILRSQSQSSNEYSSANTALMVTKFDAIDAEHVALPNEILEIPFSCR